MTANDLTRKAGGETDAPQLGVVTDASLAGGQVSHHARLGIYARWTCKGCTSTQFAGRYPCRECTGFTTDSDKVVRGVMTLKNRPNVRCPQ